MDREIKYLEYAKVVATLQAEERSLSDQLFHILPKYEQERSLLIACISADKNWLANCSFVNQLNLSVIPEQKNEDGRKSAILAAEQYDPHFSVLHRKKITIEHQLRNNRSLISSLLLYKDYFDRGFTYILVSHLPLDLVNFFPNF